MFCSSSLLSIASRHHTHFFASPPPNRNNIVDIPPTIAITETKTFPVVGFGTRFLTSMHAPIVRKRKKIDSANFFFEMSTACLRFMYCPISTPIEQHNKANDVEKRNSSLSNSSVAANSSNAHNTIKNKYLKFILE